MDDSHINFGPTGRTVYERTYSRTRADGSRETWPETVRRVAEGNLSLVYGPRAKWNINVKDEYTELVEHMEDFKILPAGRHLWASGVRGRQYLFNCHVAGWGEKLSRHYEFTFMRLMEGGGVGANYSANYLVPFGIPRRELDVHIVCDPDHPDYQDMLDAGVLSTEYNSDWAGSFDVEDSREGWAAALVDLIDTFMTDETVQHRQRVYDVSRVRGKGARLKTFGGIASGPAPFGHMMHKITEVLSTAHTVYPQGVYLGRASLPCTDAMQIDHAIAECVVSGGNRRSARMSICHWMDPNILEFLACKKDSGQHWTTNISVEVDDFFIEALVNNDPQAKQVHEAVVQGMLTNGEPGYWNSSYSNEGEVGQVVATNPCGEIALQPWENCNLGHINLDAFHKDAADTTNLEFAHQLMTRFLIRATYGDVNDAEQKDRLELNRRIGVGHFGVQGYLAKNGIRYSEAVEDIWFKSILEDLQTTVRTEARDYAFELRIPEPVKVTTVAPTGSIAKLPGVSEGIHPIYARHFLRRVRFAITDPQQAATVAKAEFDGYQVEECIYDKSGNTYVVTYPTKDKLVAEVEELGIDPSVVQSADELTLDELLEFQQLYQTYYADNAVSFTANVPEGLDYMEVADVIAARLPYLKGTTVMVDGTRPQAPYERITEDEFNTFEVTSVEDSTDEECANGSCPVR
jgi:ribonucleoside-triphosphate reductase